MSRRKKLVICVIGIIVSIVVTGVIVVKYSISAKERKAVQVAQEYLAQKYEQKMQYENLRFSWVDPSLYHVRFSPVDNPKMIFEVLVQNDFTILKNSQEFGENTSADNYYIVYFEHLMKDFLSNNAYCLWDESQIKVLQINQALYSFSFSSKLSDSMNLKEMELLIGNYWVYVRTDMIINKQSLEYEASKVFDFIQAVKENDFSPNAISIRYLVSNDNTGKEEETSLVFENWFEITDVEEIVNAMDKQFFSS